MTDETVSDDEQSGGPASEGAGAARPVGRRGANERAPLGLAARKNPVMPTSPGWAMVTGGTAGLGAEFADQLARAGWDVVLVARDSERLAEAAARISLEAGVQVELITADLETEDGLASVAARIAAPDDRITLLVNNAGYGLRGDFHENDIALEERQLTILVTAVLRLSHAAVLSMTAAGGGRIINVASVAGFVAGGTYAAAKGWVISFSRWANRRYRRGSRVAVTAVCPGFVRTEFHDRMGVDARRIPRIGWLRPAPVVRAALRASARGRAVVVPSIRYKIVVGLLKLVPPNRATGRGGLWD